jgi:hypothetical protein
MFQILVTRTFSNRLYRDLGGQTKHQEDFVAGNLKKAEEKVPSYNTFWWFLTRLNSEKTESMFRQWVSFLKGGVLKDIIAVDGKRLKGASRAKGHQNLLHIVSAWSSARGLILGQVKTEEKSNEITAEPELLDTLDISDAIITKDALSWQNKLNMTSLFLLFVPLVFIWLREFF